MSARKEIHSLTSLRGLAALAVVMQHFSATMQKHAAGPIPSLVPHGYLAVDFFFVLSGFIMCYTYLHKFQRDSTAAYLPFLARRAIRLLPLNVFVTLMLLVLAGLSLHFTGRNVFFGAFDPAIDIVGNLLLLSGLGVGTLMNGTAWSISVEGVAYLLFPLLIVAAFNRRRAVVVLTAAVAVAGMVALALSNQRLGMGSEDPARGLLRCLTEFTLGMLAYRLWADAPRSAWLGSDKATSGVLLFVGLLYLTQRDLLVALAFPLLVVAVAHNSGRIDRWLSARFPYFLGVISYSLYLIHDTCRPLALGLVRWLHPEPLGTAAALGCAFVGAMAVIPLAWLTYEWVENRSRQWLQQRFFNAPDATPPGSVTASR